MPLPLIPFLIAVQAITIADASAIDSRLTEAVKAVDAGRPADAVRLAGAVADDFERRFPRSKARCIYSSSSMSQTIVYSMIGTKAGCKTSSVVTGDFAEAYFVKGFGLYELGRMEEAVEAFAQAIALAPLTPRYWMERAEGYKALGQWDRAYKDFETAASNAALGHIDDDDAKARDTARAYRGMAFVKVEQNDLRAARKLLEKALAAKPGDPRTKEDLADLERRERR